VSPSTESEGGVEDKERAEQEEDKATIEAELAGKAEAGVFRLKNIKKMESTTMIGVKTFWPQ